MKAGVKVMRVQPWQWEGQPLPLQQPLSLHPLDLSTGTLSHRPPHRHHQPPPPRMLPPARPHTARARGSRPLPFTVASADWRASRAGGETHATVSARSRSPVSKRARMQPMAQSRGSTQPEGVPWTKLTPFLPRGVATSALRQRGEQRHVKQQHDQKKDHQRPPLTHPRPPSGTHGSPHGSPHIILQPPYERPPRLHALWQRPLSARGAWSDERWHPAQQGSSAQAGGAHASGLRPQDASRDVQRALNELDQYNGVLEWTTSIDGLSGSSISAGSARGHGGPMCSSSFGGSFVERLHQLTSSAYANRRSMKASIRPQHTLLPEHPNGSHEASAPHQHPFTGSLQSALTGSSTGYPAAPSLAVEHALLQLHPSNPLRAMAAASDYEVSSHTGYGFTL